MPVGRGGGSCKQRQSRTLVRARQECVGEVNSDLCEYCCLSAGSELAAAAAQAHHVMPQQSIVLHHSSDLRVLSFGLESTGATSVGHHLCNKQGRLFEACLQLACCWVFYTCSQCGGCSITNASAATVRVQRTMALMVTTAGCCAMVL